ncbi:MAG: transketolase family protein [Clostridiales Family XIII bacterium]|jgi:transketolase|nr:transketolase family protein [Clostridiales Family XIII bacterium]
MSINILKEIKNDNEEMRSAMCETMIELAEKNDNIILLDADLMTAMGTKPFQKKFPDRAVDVGIQEANMVGVAAGLSVAGKIPFAHTFAPFMTRRALDQVFISAAYAKLNVKLIGSDPGITASLNGGTHMPFEDMGIMRLIPQATVIEPTDTVQLKNILKQIVDIYGVHYLRVVRKTTPRVYEDGSTFTIGKSVLLRDGSDVSIIASGYLVSQALEAANLLAEENISARVIDMFTWKPIDEEAIVASADKTGAIVTAENHNIVGGLGAAVSNVLVSNKPVPVEMVGVHDQFGEVGPVGYLAERYGLTASDIVKASKRAIKRK